MKNESDKRVVDGVTYEIRQDMIRERNNLMNPQAIFSLMLALAFGVPAFLILAPIWYLIMANNKSFSQKSAAGFIPLIMLNVDKAFRDVKKELFKGLHGRVLDVGCGDGDYLKYFTAASFITELEPNPNLIPKIAKNVDAFVKEHPNIKVEMANKFVSDLDPNQPYDYIVFGNVMCEVPDQRAFLKDVDAVLKPGGKIVFQEHIRRPRGTLVGLFQDVFNLWWLRASDGCNCNRHTLEALKSIKGWQVEDWVLEHDSLGPMFLDHMAVGIITKERQETPTVSQT